MPTVKLVSLNLWNGGQLWQPVIQFLLEQQADIYCLQEARNRTEPDLPPNQRTVQEFRRLFPTHHQFFSAQFGDLTNDFGLVQSGNLLMTRWPLTTKDHIFIDRPYGEWNDAHCTQTEWQEYPATMQIAQLLVGAATFQVLNLHGPVNYDGGLATDRRVALINQVRTALKPELPSVVMGDSNMQQSNPVWQSLDSHARMALAATKTTFNMKRKTNPGYATAAVDVCLVSPEFTVRSAQCLDVDVSDHLPLVVELEL